MIPSPSTDRLTDLARHHGVAIAVGMLEAVPRLTGGTANTVVVVGPHGVIGLQRKFHIPWNEEHVFIPGNELNIIDVLGLRVGINVSYDAYFPEQTRTLALQGAELIVSCFTGPRARRLRCRYPRRQGVGARENPSDGQQHILRGGQPTRPAKAVLLHGQYCARRPRRFHHRVNRISRTTSCSCRAELLRKRSPCTSGALATKGPQTKTIWRTHAKMGCRRRNYQE